MMRKSGLFISLAGVCIVLTIILLFFLPVFQIDNIQFIGCDILSEDAVREMVTSDNNSNIFAFSKRKAISNLKNNHYIESVSITKHLPRTLVVNITEHKIRGYISHMGKFIYLSDNGLVIDIQQDINRPAPIITGLKFDTFTLGKQLEVDNPGAFDAMIDLSGLFNRYQLVNDVLRVDVNNTDNLKFYCNNVEVIYGKADGTNERILTLIEILEELDTSIPGVLDLTIDPPTFSYSS